MGRAAISLVSSDWTASSGWDSIGSSSTSLCFFFFFFSSLLLYNTWASSYYEYLWSVNTECNAIQQHSLILLKCTYLHLYYLTFLSFSLSFFFSFFSLLLFFLDSCGMLSLPRSSAGLFSTSGRWVLTGSFSLSARGLERMREKDIRWTERKGDSDREGTVTRKLGKTSACTIHGSKV